MKKIIIAVIIIIVVVLVGFIGYSKYKKDEVQKYIELGINSINTNKYNDSENYMKEALKVDGNNVEAKTVLKIISMYKDSEKDFQEGKFKEAQEVLSRIPKEESNYKINDDIIKLQNNINEKLEDEKNINNQLNIVANDLKENNLKQAQINIGKIDVKKANEEQNQEIEKYNSEIKEKEAQEEKAQKEAEAKKEKVQKMEEEKAQALRSQQELKVQKVNKAKGNQSNSLRGNESQVVSASSVEATNPNTYVSPELGLSITFPESWSGKYYIKSKGKDGLIVMMKSNHKMQFPDEGELFEIDSASTYGILDGPKIIKSKNGITYYAGPQTGMTIDESDPQFKEWEGMSRDTYNVVSTIKAI